MESTADEKEGREIALKCDRSFKKPARQISQGA